MACCVKCTSTKKAGFVTVDNPDWLLFFRGEILCSDCIEEIRASLPLPACPKCHSTRVAYFMFDVFKCGDCKELYNS